MKSGKWLVIDITVAGNYGEPQFLGVAESREEAVAFIEHKYAKRGVSEYTGRSHWWDALGEDGAIYEARYDPRVIMAIAAVRRLTPARLRTERAVTDMQPVA